MKNDADVRGKCAAENKGESLITSRLKRDRISCQGKGGSYRQNHKDKDKEGGGRVPARP